MITLSYTDAEALRTHQLEVRAVNDQIIRKIISDRVSDELVGKQREAAINKLKSHFEPILVELDGVLTRLVGNVGIGMDSFQKADNHGANSFS